MVTCMTPVAFNKQKAYSVANDGPTAPEDLWILEAMAAGCHHHLAKWTMFSSHLDVCFVNALLFCGTVGFMGMREVPCDFAGTVARRPWRESPVHSLV